MSLNGVDVNLVAGIAALVNSLLLVPTVRSLKTATVALRSIAEDHGARITALERKKRSKGRRGAWK